jgi:hypothetical protein
LNASLIVKTSRALSIGGREEDSEACRTNVVFAEAVILVIYTSFTVPRTKHNHQQKQIINEEKRAFKGKRATRCKLDKNCKVSPKAYTWIYVKFTCLCFITNMPN